MELSESQTTEFLRRLSLDPLSGADVDRYVPLDLVRGYRKMTSMDTLYKALRTIENACLLFSGFPGSGKTTELKRLEERLDPKKAEPIETPRNKDPRPTKVVFIDGGEFFDLFQPLNIADILRVIAYRLDEAANLAKTGTTKPKKRFVDHLVDFLKNTKIELHGKVDLSQYTNGKVNLMLEFKNNPTFGEAAREAIAQRGQAFLDLAKKNIHDSVDEIRRVNGENTRVVVIVDGLEKIQPIDEKDRERIEKSVEHLFVNQAPLLRIPCHVVYTFPLWLQYRQTISGSFDAPPIVLPMVKVWDKDKKAVHQEGCDALKEVLRKRIDLRTVFGPEPSPHLDDLIRASGGYLRDLLRLVREVILAGDDFPADSAYVQDVIGKLEQDYSKTLLGTDLDILAEVALDHKPPQDSGTRMAAFARLYEKRLILAYLNGNEWYNVHPLIQKNEMLLRAKDKVAKRRKKDQNTKTP